jgi:hypothetical protein
MDKVEARRRFMASEMQYWLYRNNGLAKVVDPDERIEVCFQWIDAHLNAHGLDLLTEDD